jgi:hypothetical protein
MSDYPMLISNKLHSFRNFSKQKYVLFLPKAIFERSSWGRWGRFRNISSCREMRCGSELNFHLYRTFRIFENRITQVINWEAV